MIQPPGFFRQIADLLDADGIKHDKQDSDRFRMVFDVLQKIERHLRVISGEHPETIGLRCRPLIGGETSYWLCQKCSVTLHLEGADINGVWIQSRTPHEEARFWRFDEIDGDIIALHDCTLYQREKCIQIVDKM